VGLLLARGKYELKSDIIRIRYEGNLGGNAELSGPNSEGIDLISAEQFKT
jgi:hypothetical protein